MSSVSNQILKRIYLLFGLLAIFSFLIVFQVVNIQWIKGDKWLSDTNKHKRVYYKPVLADRGSIMSDDGSTLATTLPYFRIAVDAKIIRPQHFPNFEDSLNVLSRQLAEFVKSDSVSDAKDFKRMILNGIQQKDQHLYLFPYKRLLDFNEMKYISSLPILNRGRFEGGLIVEKVNHTRFNPMGELCKVTLGKIDEGSTHGTKGIEYSFNSALRGKDGEMLVQRIAGDVEVPIDFMYQKAAQDGADIQTTINVNMQDVVYSSLKRAVDANKAKQGVAILMEVQTGEIKALANYPEYYNYAIAAQSEPGSTFKLASTIALLEDKLIQPQDTVETGNGKTQYADAVMRDEHPYGKLTFKQVFEKSSNVGFAHLVNTFYSKDPNRYIQRLEDMGVLSYLDFQIKGEPAPYVIKPKNPFWNKTTLPWLSIGYNVKLTPLQLLSFYNAIANEGKMIQPIIVSQILNQGQVEQSFKTRVIREKICSDQTLATIQKMLEGVVDHGTARNIRGSHYKIAGKTGTSKNVVDGQYMDSYQSSFVGYFPADAPRYSLIVVISEPTAGQYYGAHVAAPVFREIADQIYSTLLVENYRDPLAQSASAQTTKRMPYSRIMNQADAATFYRRFNISTPVNPGTDWVRVKNNRNYVDLKPHPVIRRKMPVVTGMSAKDAIALLESLGLRVKMNGYGRVQYQSIRPNSRFRKGETITLNLT